MPDAASNTDDLFEIMELGPSADVGVVPPHGVSFSAHAISIPDQTADPQYCWREARATA